MVLPDPEVSGDRDGVLGLSGATRESVHADNRSATANGLRNATTAEPLDDREVFI